MVDEGKMAWRRREINSKAKCLHYSTNKVFAIFLKISRKLKF